MTSFRLYVFPSQLQALYASYIYIYMYYIMEKLRAGPTPLGYIREGMCPWMCP